VPGKIIWASLTYKLNGLLGINHYNKIGEFLKKAMRFGYLYLYVDNQLYLPSYTKEGLKLGQNLQYEFEKKFISSQAFATIDPHSFTAEEGMLHEVEFIKPYTINEGKPVFLKGLIWIRNIYEENLKIFIENNTLKIKAGEKEIDFRKQLINYLQLGGERKYGFGLIEINNFEEISDMVSEGFYGKWAVKNEDIIIYLPKDMPIFAHVKYSDSLELKGDIELLVEREWDLEKGAGRNIRSHGLCWVPGSLLKEDEKFKITEFGIWGKKC
jgi:hypothetical protein